MQVNTAWALRFWLGPLLITKLGLDSSSASSTTQCLRLGTSQKGAFGLFGHINFQDFIPKEGLDTFFCYNSLAQMLCKLGQSQADANWSFSPL